MTWESCWWLNTRQAFVVMPTRRMNGARSLAARRWTSSPSGSSSNGEAKASAEVCCRHSLILPGSVVYAGSAPKCTPIMPLSSERSNPTASTPNAVLSGACRSNLTSQVSQHFEVVVIQAEEVRHLVNDRGFYLFFDLVFVLTFFFDRVLKNANSIGV